MMYTQTGQPDNVLRDADGAIIPFAEGNVDYWQYQQWLAEGNTPAPAPPPPVPTPYTPPQEESPQS